MNGLNQQDETMARLQAELPTLKQIGGEHYLDCPIQPAHFCHANGIPFLEGSAIKYIVRHRKKGGAEDIRKAIHFLEMILHFQYQKQNEPQ